MYLSILLACSTSSAQSSPVPVVALEPPDVHNYIIWGGKGAPMEEFSNYRDKSVEEVISIFKGLVINGIKHEFM